MTNLLDSFEFFLGEEVSREIRECSIKKGIAYDSYSKKVIGYVEDGNIYAAGFGMPAEIIGEVERLDDGTYYSLTSSQ